MSVTIAYYHPREISPNSNRASDIRVAKMLEAFQKLGLEVIILAGPPRQRHRAIRKFQDDVKQGLKVEFVYGECTNAPIALAEKTLLPSNFLVDYHFFYWLKASGIPNGLFYRDIYWRFDIFHEQLPWPLSTLLKPLYYLDWRVYDKFWDILFLPSQGMNQHLPRPRQQDSFLPLPPGFENTLPARPPYTAQGGEPLKLLYVGGVEPTAYDLTEVLRLVANRDNIELTICCREQEWQKFYTYYKPHISHRVNIAHVNRHQLADYYHRADLFIMIMPKTDYMDFAAPVKFFEAIGYAIPMVSMNQKEVARIIETCDIGWVVDSIPELSALLTDISDDRTALSDKHDKLLSYRESCSWIHRGRTVQHLLECDTRKSRPS